MIDWFAWVSVALAAAAGVFCVVQGLMGRAPNDYTLGTTLLIEVLLLAHLITAIVGPISGNSPTGDALEFYAYLITAIIMLPLAGFWSLTDRSRWSNVVLGVANLAVGVMLIRMLDIWYA